MEKIRKIGIVSFAKFQAVLGMIIGLVFGVIYSIGGFIIDLFVTIGWIASMETPGLSYGTVLAFGALIGMPIIFSLGGFALGLLEAILYNLLAKWFGGLRIHLEYDG